VTPSSGLRADIATPDGKRRYVRRLFATIADRYDFITGFLSYGQDRQWKQRLIQMAELRANDRVLDLACGTGDILFSAVPPAQSGVGLDVTHRMVQLAQQRRNDPRTPLVTADMLALPFVDGRFTVVTTGYGLRNVPDLDQALREILRGLRLALQFALGGGRRLPGKLAAAHRPDASMRTWP